MNTLDYSYDPLMDVFTIEGVKYSGDMLRTMPKPREDQLLRIVKNEDGVVTFQTYRVNLAEFEAWQKER
jgi:hypothetical protein